MHTIAVWTIKGGVGKTAAAVNLAHAASIAGIRTLLWDLDPQGAASFYLRAVPALPGGVKALVLKSEKLVRLAQPTEFDNLHLLPSDFSYRHLDLALEARKKPKKLLAKRLQPFDKRFDLVLIDCPPSVSLVSEAVLRAADALLVPVIPTILSMRTLDQVQSFVADAGRHRPLVLPFLSMVDRRKRMHLDICDQCLADGLFLRTTIPSASVVEKMGLTRAPVAATLPSQPAARAFNELWREIAKRLEIGPPAVGGGVRP
jgi:cellulose biosynthesis protein BcsQ